MKQSMRIRVDYIAPSLNSIYAGIHWSKRKKHADAAHLATKLALRGHRMRFNAVSLDFYPMIRGRRFNCSNYAYGCKLVEDQIVRCGLLTDDSHKYVKRFTIHAPESVSKPENSHLIVVISET